MHRTVQVLKVRATSFTLLERPFRASTFFISLTQGWCPGLCYHSLTGFNDNVFLNKNYVKFITKRAFYEPLAFRFVVADFNLRLSVDNTIFCMMTAVKTTCYEPLANWLFSSHTWHFIAVYCYHIILATETNPAWKSTLYHRIFVEFHLYTIMFHERCYLCEYRFPSL